ncbi:hypothetical protein CPB85DRAFT_1437704 [Mucidula mucida]|nr:hypothetical protein CPB85DRAFT_1437704 [Mucidula mucida]
MSPGPSAISALPHPFFGSSNIPMAVEVRWKDDPKRLPLLSRIFEWLEAKKPGLGRQIVLRENEVDNPNEWKARLINDNADIAAQFPGDTRLPHPMEWKSIRPDRERWGDEAKAVEEVYNRLGKNYRQAQRKRKIELDSVAAAAAADRASQRLRTTESSGPPQQHRHMFQNVEVAALPKLNGPELQTQNIAPLSSHRLKCAEAAGAPVASGLCANLREVRAALEAIPEEALDRLQHLLECEALQIEKKTLIDRYNTMQREKESHADALADLKLHYEALREAKEKLVLWRDQVDSLHKDKERMEARVAELETRYAVSEVEKGQLEAELASARARVVHLEEQSAGLQVQKEEVEAQMRADFEKRLAALRVEKEAADLRVEELVEVAGRLSDTPSENETDENEQNELAAVLAHNVALQAKNNDLEEENADLKKRNKNLTLVVELLEAAAAP